MRKRTFARECALKILYRIEISKESIEASLKDFWSKSADSADKEAHDFACIAQMATLSSRIPFVHFFDGFRTSHEVSKIDIISDEQLKTLMDEDLKEVARWENDPAIYKLPTCLLPWGDRDLLVMHNGIVDPLTGDTMQAFTCEDPETQWVTDWPGIGPSRFVRAYSDRFEIYGPADGNVRYDSALLSVPLD